jgi:hypothetical protein
MNYQCISADSHLEIRPDRYTCRVAAKYRDRAPKVITLEDGTLDHMVFAVKQETGLTSFTDIRERRFPLKLSLRGQPDHSLHMITDHVLSAAGFSLDDIVSWGGEVRYDAGMPYGANRIGAVQRGEIQAIFDEGVSAWGNMALQLGMNFLRLDEPLLARLEAVGLRRGLIEKKQFPETRH